MIKLNQFSLYNDYLTFFFKINKSAYYKFVTQKDKTNKILQEKRENIIFLYISDTVDTKLKEYFSNVTLGDLAALCKKIGKLREKIYSVILFSNPIIIAKKDLSEYISYKYFFERYFLHCCASDYINFFQSFNYSFLPYRYFLEDKNLLKYFLETQKEFMAPVSKISDCYLRAILLSEEEDYLIKKAYDLGGCE